MDQAQKRLECPFTWGIEKQWACDYDEMEEPIVSFEDEPLLSFISLIMITYIRAEKADYEGAFANLKSTNITWERLVDTRQQEIIEVSTKVLRHVKISTEYFIYDLTEQKEKAEKLLNNLESSESFQDTYEAATIDGCKAIAWSMFHEDGKEKAEAFARNAISKSPNCPLWYYTLGKCLRFSRHELYGNFDPSSEEQDAIIKSCKLSMSRPFYQIFLAQMYREKQDYSKAQEIYLDIFHTKSKNSGILLRLASGFMSISNDFIRAKKCLDEVSKTEQNSMFHHVMATFNSKQKRYKNAAFHYEMAAMKGNNFKADFQHALSLQRLNKDYDFIEHLQKMLLKYDQNIRYKQELFLHIAMQYYFKKIDIAKAVSYILRAIELRPESQQLTRLFNTTVDWKTYNIYDFLNKILRYNEWYRGQTSNPKFDDLRKLEEYCKNYHEAQLGKSLENITL